MCVELKIYNSLNLQKILDILKRRDSQGVFNVSVDWIGPETIGESWTDITRRGC